MELTAQTKIDDLLTEYPFLIDHFTARSQKFVLLKNPAIRNTVGKSATMMQAASIGGVELESLLAGIAAEIKVKTGQEVFVKKNEPGAQIESLTDDDARQEVLKDIIKDLHAGADMAALKKRFHDLIKNIDPSEIARMEQGLMDEGMPGAEVRRLCDVHVEVFKESLANQKVPTAPPGHPLHTFMMENRAAEGIIHELGHVLAKTGDTADRESFKRHQARLAALVDRLADINLHFLRKENQLFPALERRHISGPSQVMWVLHDDIRIALKAARAGIADMQVPDVYSSIRYAVKSMAEMIYKEEHILFPMAGEILTDEDWGAVKKGEDEVGYAWIAPEKGWMPSGWGASPSNRWTSS